MRILHAAETISTNVRCVMYQQESYQNRIIHILVSHLLQRHLATPVT